MKSTRMTNRRGLGWVTWVNPASSARSFHGMREVRNFGKAIRGSTATHPAGSPAT